MQTIPYTGIGKEVDGYIVNWGLGKELTAAVESIQDRLAYKFADEVWLTPPETLHITLFDLLAPLVEYRKPKPELFEERFSEYDDAIEKIITNQKPIKVRFSEIHVSPAAIFIQGYDNGDFARIRNDFLKKVLLEEGTKQPPQIIHSTIARFSTELEMSNIEAELASCALDEVVTVDNFRLVHEQQNPLLKSEIIKTYLLQ